jgi:glycosyltransferase involved in cell wall biosynthesis
MDLKNKIPEKLSYYVKRVYSQYVGKGRHFKKSLAAAQLEDWDALHEINVSSRMPGSPLPISAIVRIKNAEATLMVAVESIVTYCKEIILIDHQSTDLSPAIIKVLADKYPGVVKAHVYDKPTARAGAGYSNQVLSGEGSLAEYYNFCFSLGAEEYLLKWDSDNLALPTFWSEIKKGINRKAERIYFDGIDLFGVFSCSNEGSVFRRDLEWKFEDREFCEVLDIKGNVTKYTARCPVFVHLKQLT